MMKDVVLTRQAVTTRIAEFYDPAGIVEPIKLQLKLLLAKLNGKDWKTPLTSEEQAIWKKQFVEFVEFHQIRVPRCGCHRIAETRTSDKYVLRMRQLRPAVRLSMQVWRYHLESTPNRGLRLDQSSQRVLYQGTNSQ